ncbi:MAG: site-specific DNA-methyltransferase [Desulfovibrio fairfieldensis]|nr:site-specific DNA-methyltransferase [Desulfovibrio fairfieldensis]
MTAFVSILTGDALAMLRTLPDQSVQCCVTSPPYWGLRDYGVPGQIGLESSPQEYVAALLPIFQEVKRVLRADGTLWLNLGDSYIGYHVNKRAHGSAAPSDVGANGLKNKDMAGIPWRVAFALQDAGWYLRCDCIWAKPNPMPESVQDRPTRAHEYLFLFSKSERYYYDHEAVKEPAVHAADAPRNRWDTKDYAIPGQKPQKRTTRGPGNWGVVPCGFPGENPGRGRTSGPVRDGNASRNRRSVWTIATRPFPDAHSATFPPDLIRPCILAGCPVGGVVLDPFFGAGTVGVVCVEEGRRYIGIELNSDYVEMASGRIAEAEMKAKAPKQASLLQLERAI